MKRLLFAIMLVAIPLMMMAQMKTVSKGFAKVGSATTTWVAVALRSTIEMDLAFANRDTDSDTLKIAFNKADTAAASMNGGQCLFILANETHNIGRVMRDTIWVRSSGTTPYTITGALR